MRYLYNRSTRATNRPERNPPYNVAMMKGNILKSNIYPGKTVNGNDIQKTTAKLPCKAIRISLYLVL